MSIIRIKKNKIDPFVRLNKEPLFDEKISLRAKGLWAQCLARPDNWTFYVKEIEKHSTDGRDAIYTAINELIKHNYAIRINYIDKGEDGKIRKGGIEYIFFENPITEQEKKEYLDEFKKSFQHRDFQDPGLPGRTNPPLLTKEKKKQRKELVLYSTPCGANSDEISSVELEKEGQSKEISSIEAKKEEALKLAQEASSMPRELTKPHFDGTSITVSLNDVFLASTKKRSDWTTREIHDAWKILAEYKGFIRSPVHFIEGTIKNLRNEKKVKYLKKEGKICTNSDILQYTNCKPISSEDDTPGLPSLSFLDRMKEMGLT